jgi:hypothetical protein
MKAFVQNLNKFRVIDILKRGTVGVIGFILSPLSWWNDAVVNFPLAFGFAWIVGKVLRHFINLFVAGYFLTNLLGFLMMHYSLFGTKKDKGTSIKKQIFISVIYTLVVVAFFGLGVCNSQKGCPVLPSWVAP